ncbi:MAG: TRAP transporter large permease subunit, partial [Gammaproteobacteria bacterium]|nr:TRAP transporter large permease subunit [Gammaproteobacteria bacterium]
LVVELLGYDIIWFGVLTLMMLEIGLATPPFGLLLFVVKGAAPPGTSMAEVIRSIAPFIAMALLVVALIIAVPDLALLLPGMMR